MKITRVVAAVAQAAFCAFALTVSSAGAQAAATNEHGAAAHQLTLDNGKKWATDPALREGMTAIRDLLASDYKSIERASLPAAQLADIAKKIDAQVEYIIANCRLPADADANLHIILMDIIAGSEAMQGKSRVKTPVFGSRLGSGNVRSSLTRKGVEGRARVRRTATYYFCSTSSAHSEMVPWMVSRPSVSEAGPGWRMISAGIS